MNMTDIDNAKNGHSHPKRTPRDMELLSLSSLDNFTLKRFFLFLYKTPRKCKNGPSHPNRDSQRLETTFIVFLVQFYIRIYIFCF